MPFKKIGGTEKGGRVSSIPVRVTVRFNLIYFIIETQNVGIIIPPSLREEILSALHAAHQGVTSMISRAESSVFWPSITPAITALRAGCNHCNRIAPSNPSAPPTPLMSLDYPFQCVCSDFFQYKGINYLVVVDRYSN